MASLWEITIKEQLGKLRLGMMLDEFFERFVKQRQLTVLPIDLPGLLSCGHLPLLHRDPFDRILIAQAVVEDIPIVTADPQFSRYAVTCLW